jgi:hypothetical protein
VGAAVGIGVRGLHKHECSSVWAWRLEDGRRRSHPRHPDLAIRSPSWTTHLLLVLLPPPPAADRLPTLAHQRPTTGPRCPTAWLSDARAQTVQELARTTWRRERARWQMRTTVWGESNEAMASPPPLRRSCSRASSPSSAPPTFSVHIGCAFLFASWNR